VLSVNIHDSMMSSAFERFCPLLEMDLPIFYACKRLLYSIPEDLVIIEIRFKSYSPSFKEQLCCIRSKV